MNGHQRDAQVPTCRECLLPSVARTSSVTQITPAKKITFLKRGDARFSGVQLAVHQRTFKSFGALMDELSQRVPLSFGVRSVTTPRGLHCLSTLEQLEDGGCYFCSDRKPPQAPRGPDRQQGRDPSAQLSGDFEGQRGASETPSSWKGPKVPRRILLVKNTEPRVQRTVVLSPRDTSSFSAFLRKASDVLHVPVKRVFTTSGKKVDSLHGLLHSPLVLVCAGQEPFRPPAMEHFRRRGTETSFDLTSKNKNGSWGPKAKPSIIHSRSKSGGRSRPLSGLSERSGLSDPPGSLHRTWLGSAIHRHPQDTPTHLGPLVAGDDFEKQVHMNEDGSLSVEMKIRFHLLSEDTLLWSTGIRRASDLTTANEEHLIQGEVPSLQYCPTPPRGQPCAKKHSSSSSSRSSSSSNQSADWRPGGSEQGPETLNGLSTLEIRRSSPRPTGTSQGKMSGDGEDLEEPEEDGGVVPSALPYFSPEAVVCEWLAHIPEDPILMKYEMVDESPTVAGVGPEGPQEGPVDKYSLEGLRELAQAREPQPLEGAASEGPKLDAGPVTDDADPQSKEPLSQREASKKGPDVYKGVRASNRRGVGHSVSKGVLPIRVPTSVQVMRAFISLKPGRSSSMPEVSTVAGRRLGRFAHSLLTCLAGLHFFDEDHGSPGSRVRFTDSPQFQELLATLQSLWPQCDELDLGHQEFRLGQALSILASHPGTEDVTPTSSSGVDVSSGSAGSGEGSGPCPGEGTFPPGRMELPLQLTTSIIPCQELGTRTSEQQEGLGNQHPICPQDSSDSPGWACKPSPDEAGENGRDHVLGSSLEQLVESTMQKEGVPAGQSQEEREKEETQEASDPEEEFLDGESVNKQEVTGLQDRGAGRARDSTDLRPAEMNQEPIEPWNRAPGRGSPAREHQRSPTFEPGLKKLSRNNGMAAEQSQVTPAQGTIAPRVPLDPDPIWVHKLLKKMEKAFMTHFASAATTVRAHWGLENHHVLDQMVAELEQDLGRRLQDSITKELSKILRRAGKKAPRPPREALHWEMSLQTGQRRRRLQGLRNLSAFTEPTRVSGFLSLEDEPFPSGTLGSALGGKVEEEEFCPCETCLRKNMSPTSPRGKTEAGGAPIEKAFDLQQILQKRKGGCPDGEAAEDGGWAGSASPAQKDQLHLRMTGFQYQILMFLLE
ncbi:retinitis pigmentosa 1-like 1 protein [Tenrec ecaudatus]|uniref:retinitis pigmentosa 1-like 1 protein n=1 Tax=Tenrec ecaudatus TaxID=94439 RepID=UPI003F5A3C19